MNEYFSLLTLTFGITIGAFVILWLASIPLRDTSIVDRFWGPGCALPAWIAYVMANGASDRKLLVTTLVTLWAARLCYHITKRNWGHGEDPRYAKLRSWTKPGQSFHWISLRQVFLLQGLCAWVVSLPLQVAQVYPEPQQLGWLALLGTIVWFVGVFFEAVSDYQLKRFKSQPMNEGKLMDQGLWAWTRHPNYFGDLTVWVGLTLIACEHPIGLLTIVSPLVMGHFLLNITGKRLLEKGLRQRYPDYAEYERRTSGFFPMPPKD